MLSHNLIDENNVENIKKHLREILGEGCCVNFDTVFDNKARVKRGIIYSKPYEHSGEIPDITNTLGLLLLIKDSLEKPDIEKLKNVFSDKFKSRIENTPTPSKEKLQNILMHSIGIIHYGNPVKAELFINFQHLAMALNGALSNPTAQHSKSSYSIEIPYSDNQCDTDPVLTLPFIDDKNYKKSFDYSNGRMYVTVHSKEFPMSEHELDYITGYSMISRPCLFFVDCVTQCVKLPIELAKEFMGFLSDPRAYSKDLIEGCPGYFPPGQWNKVHSGINKQLFFAASTNTSLCEQLASCPSSPQIII